MTTSSPEHPARVHGRAIALVTHYRAGDMQAVATLLDELHDGGVEITGATLASLTQLCSRVLDERPTDPDAWLQAALLHLAAAEGDVA